LQVHLWLSASSSTLAKGAACWQSAQEPPRQAYLREAWTDQDSAERFQLERLLLLLLLLLRLLLLLPLLPDWRE
jgi:hypothetical protein